MIYLIARVIIYNIDVNGVEGYIGEPNPKSKIYLNSYPNPFNNKSQIKYSIREYSTIEINIYNIYGQLVRTLFEGNKEPGQYAVSWNGSDRRNKKMPNGIYIVKLKSNRQTITNKLILIK